MHLPLRPCRSVFLRLCNSTVGAAELSCLTSPVPPASPVGSVSNHLAELSSVKPTSATGCKAATGGTCCPPPNKHLHAPVVPLANQPSASGARLQRFITLGPRRYAQVSLHPVHVLKALPHVQSSRDVVLATLIGVQTTVACSSAFARSHLPNLCSLAKRLCDCACGFHAPGLMSLHFGVRQHLQVSARDVEDI